MKTIKAFAVSLLLCALTIVGLHLYSGRGFSAEGKAGTWVSDAKSQSGSTLKKMAADEKALLIFGSSELRHGQGSGFQGDTIFDGADMNPVYVGKAGYQSLTHAITLGAVGSQAANKKAVLIVSPQWFKENGVKSTAFEAAFSEEEYIALLENPDISQETKDYINGRLQNIMADNENMSERVKKVREWYQPKDDNTAEQPGWLEQKKADFHKVLLEEKNNYKVMAEALMDGISNHKSKESGAKLSQATWEQLRKEAETEGHKLSDGNDYGMFDSVYKGTYQTLIANGKHKNPKYTLDYMEFSDLECFLSICREEGIEPLVVILPFNGYWYDYTELTAEERSVFYEKIRCIAEDYGVQCADLSGNEYTEYYFEDNSHPALKGLVDLNEAIYEFYRKVCLLTGLPRKTTHIRSANESHR